MIIKINIQEKGTRAWVGETEDKMTRMNLVPKDVTEINHILSTITKRSIEVFKPRNYAQREGAPNDSGNGSKGVEGVPE